MTIQVNTVLNALPRDTIKAIHNAEPGHVPEVLRLMLFVYVNLPATPIELTRYDSADYNRLCRDFTKRFCDESGTLNWRKVGSARRWAKVSGWQ
jgi:hypothetical protein